jgi:ABC-2 type transport system permease protein
VKRIIGIELSKISTYGFFRIVVILHFVLYLLVTFVISRIKIEAPGITPGNLFIFPNVWSTFAYIASWFNMFLAIIVIVLTANEFSHKTFRQQVLSGLSRNEFLFGKGILILGLAIYGFLLVTITGLIYGFIYTESVQISQMFDKFYIILIYIVQAIGYMTLGVMAAIIFRNVSLSIILFLLYFIFIEPITRLFCPLAIRPWFPVKVISHLTPVPEVLKMTTNMGATAPPNNEMSFEKLGLIPAQLPVFTNLVIAVVYILLFITLIFWLIRKRDI